MRGRIIALVGPSGIGKDYVKKEIKIFSPCLKELTVITTRPKRKSDGINRDAGVSLMDFESKKESGKIIGDHQPFGKSGPWYGFYKEQIENLLEEGEIILTEIHIDNVELFREKYKETLSLIGFISEKSYLECNLKERSSESEKEIALRINKGLKEIEEIKKMKEKGFIDEVVEVGWENRESLKEIVVEIVRKKVEHSFELKNEIKLN